METADNYGANGIKLTDRKLSAATVQWFTKRRFCFGFSLLHRRMMRYSGESKHWLEPLLVFGFC